MISTVVSHALVFMFYEDGASHIRLPFSFVVLGHLYRLARLTLYLTVTEAKGLNLQCLR